MTAPASTVLTALLVALLQGAARATIVYFNCFPLDGAQEVPPSGSPGSGIGYCTLDTATNEFAWNVSYGGLTSVATMAHFHAAIPGVVGPITINAGIANPTIGTFTVTPPQAIAIQAGKWYFNVHTVGQPDGELRGQVVNAGCPVVTLDCLPIDGSQVVPPKAVPGSGTATCTLDTATNELTWHISYGGLTGPATAAHFHSGLPGAGGGALVASLGTASPLVDSMTVAPAQAAEIVTGRWYVDVHTSTNPGGELRGQLLDGSCAQWEDLHHAKAGVTGPPVLLGIGPLTGGSLSAIDLLNAAAGSSTTLIVGFSPIDAPLKGGILVPAPTILLPGLPTSAAGKASLPVAWPADAALIGFELYWQQWIPDAAASSGVAASNGLRSTGQ